MTLLDMPRLHSLHSEVADRACQVLSLLLREDRTPDPDTLALALAPLVGRVLKDNKLTRTDRAGAVKVMAAAATYCWYWLPATTWTRLEAYTDSAGNALPLVWRCPDGSIVADLLLTGVVRDATGAAQSALAELRTVTPPGCQAVDAVRALPVQMLDDCVVATFQNGLPTAEPLWKSPWDAAAGSAR